MRQSRALLALATVTLLVVACGGSVVYPDSSSSSGGSSSGGSSSGASSGASGSSSSASSGASGSSSGTSGTSGGSTSGSSGGTCVAGQVGPPICPGCNGSTNEICVNGGWQCPPIPPCPPPPPCSTPPPPCACPIDCKCQPVCDPSTSKWTCETECAMDAGGGPFACGNKTCSPGAVCIDVPGTGPYECIPNPSQCAGDYSCPCEMNALAQAGTCKPVSCETIGGGVVVHCYSL